MLRQLQKEKENPCKQCRVGLALQYLDTFSVHEFCAEVTLGPEASEEGDNTSNIADGSGSVQILVVRKESGV